MYSDVYVKLLLAEEPHTNKNIILPILPLIRKNILFSSGFLSN